LSGHSHRPRRRSTRFAIERRFSPGERPRIEARLGRVLLRSQAAVFPACHTLAPLLSSRPHRPVLLGPPDVRRREPHVIDGPDRTDTELRPPSDGYAIAAGLAPSPPQLPSSRKNNKRRNERRRPYDRPSADAHSSR
jgi:hypothetical protein